MAVLTLLLTLAATAAQLDAATTVACAVEGVLFAVVSTLGKSFLEGIGTRSGELVTELIAEWTWKRKRLE